MYCATADVGRRGFHELRDGEAASGQGNAGHHLGLLGRLHQHRGQANGREADAVEPDGRGALAAPQTLDGRRRRADGLRIGEALEQSLGRHSPRESGQFQSL